MKSLSVIIVYIAGFLTGACFIGIFSLHYAQRIEAVFSNDEKILKQKYDKLEQKAQLVKSNLEATAQSLEVYKSIASVALVDVDKKAIIEAPKNLNDLARTNCVKPKKAK
jgi:hypothetical protein